MNVYKLTRKNLRCYDDFVSITVRASSEQEARELAAQHVRDEDSATGGIGAFLATDWLRPERTEVVALILGDGPVVIASEFRHG